MKLCSSALQAMVLIACTLAGCAPDRPRVVIGFVSGTLGATKLSIYDGATGKTVAVPARGFYNSHLLGYDETSDTWVLDGDPLKGQSQRLFGVRNGKVRPLRDRDLPAVLEWKGTWQPSRVARGGLEVEFYDLKGSPSRKRLLRVPGRAIKDYWNYAAAGNGYVAAVVWVSGSSETRMYVFDDSGRVAATLARGSMPQFAQGGRLLLYSDFSMIRGSDGEIAPPETGSGDVVVYDIAAKHGRSFNVDSPPDADLAGPAQCVLTEDGRSLVCSYSQWPVAERPVYAVNITHIQPVWHRLPFKVHDGQWIVLDRAPECPESAATPKRR